MESIVSFIYRNRFAVAMLSRYLIRIMLKDNFKREENLSVEMTSPDLALGEKEDEGLAAYSFVFNGRSLNP